MGRIFEEMKKRHEEMKEWFYALHRKPELAFEEEATSAFVAEKLKSWGYEVEEKVGRTGLVASMTLGDGQKKLGLRADMDALPIQEENDLEYKSQIPGKSHLCGHDGHVTMLLGAAKYLADTRNFNGAIRLIFQPAEEIMGGSLAMIEDGLFERFPMDAVFAMHNMPGLKLGTFHFYEGEMMSAVDNWEIELTGKGSHGSMPEKSIDPLVAGASLVMALQTIVSRNIPAMNNSVLSVGAFQSGEAGNVIPANAILRLSMRNIQAETRTLMLERIRAITKAQAECYNCKWEIREGTPGAVLVTDTEMTRYAMEVAEKTFGPESVGTLKRPYMASEDFAFMLQQRKGTYFSIGNGEDAQMPHNPGFIVNLDLLPYGAAYWAALAEDYLK